MTRPSSIGKLRLHLDSPLASVDEAAFILAEDAHPNIELGRYRAQLDGYADQVAGKLGRGSALRDQVAALAEVLYAHAGLRGNREDYYDPRNSYLTDVLDRKLGIPISLAVVILAVARRAGIVAEAIGFPGHVIARVGGPAGVLVDPFEEGRVLKKQDLLEILRRVLGDSAELRPSHLQPIDARAVVVRMLSNLRTIHEQRKDHASALVVCDRLVELDAGPPARRDRGLHALALGARAAAASDLAAYLQAAPQAPDRVEVERALERASANASWN